MTDQTPEIVPPSRADLKREAELRDYLEAMREADTVAPDFYEGFAHAIEMFTAYRSDEGKAALRAVADDMERINMGGWSSDEPPLPAGTSGAIQYLRYRATRWEADRG